MNIEAFMAAQLARPITHNVVTTYSGGCMKVHGCRSIGAAENYAIGERRKIGRVLWTDGSHTAQVRVVNVEIVTL